MVVAEVLTGIALVQQSVKFIKENISTAQADHPTAVAEKQVQEQRAKKSGSGIGDQFGINKVAQEVIDARLAQEKINEMRTLVDMRFGPGTWQSIVDERARRIQEAKEQAAQARKEQRLKQQELEEAIKTTLIIGGVILVAVALFAFLMVSVAWAAGY